MERPIYYYASPLIFKGKQYISVTDLGKDAQKDRKGAYDIYQYCFLDKDTIEVQGMETDVLRKAIANKKLAGAIDKDQNRP